MSTLHIVNKTGQPFSLCLRSLGEHDVILFIEDGVYNLHASPEALADIGQTIYALASDCRARGVLIDGDRIRLASMDDFIELTEQHSKTLSWF